MDGQTLQQLFAGNNPFLAQMGEQAFNLEQQRKQADLATLLSQEERAKAMHPIDIASKQANIRQSDAAAGYNTALSAKINDELKVLNGVPMDQRVADHVAKLRSSVSAEQLKNVDSEMESLLGAASAAASNGGSLPLGYTLQNPKHAEYFKTPQGAKLAMQLSKAYFMSKPKEMYAVSNDARDTARAVEVAKIGANARIEAASKAAQRQQLKSPKTNIEAAYYYQRMAETADTEEERAKWQAEAEKARQAHEAELVQRAILAWQTAQGGKPAIGQLGGIPVNPRPGEAPSRNAQPTSQPASSNGWSVRVVPKQ